MSQLSSLALSLALAAASPAAQALELPPFEPGQRVYLVPDDFRFPTQAVRQAVGEVEHPVYVVVYEQVIDGTIESGHESETEDAIEALWAEWRTAAGLLEAPAAGGYDGTEGSLVLLAMDDREVRVVTGTRWDSELSLHNDALLPIIDQHFMPMAQAGDYDGGLAALVTGLDTHIGDRIEAAARREIELAEARERAAREAAEAQRRAIERDEAIGRWLRWGGALVALGLLLLGLLVVRLGAVRSRRQFEEVEARLLAQLETADAIFADFRIDVELRDRIVDLRLKGPVTTALYEEVSHSLDEIQVGLSGLRRHVEECRSTAQQRAGFFGQKPWKEAWLRVDGPLVVASAQVPDRLFPAPDQELKVEPAVFIRGLEERFATAKQGWKRVLDAVDASLHRADADLPRADLEAMLAELEQAGLPAVWVEDHPLYEDPRACWAELDTLRLEDPAAYLEALEDHIEDDDELEALVEDLVHGVQSAKALVAAVQEPDVSGLDTIIDDPQRDPAPTQSRVDALADQLQAIALAQLEPDPETFRSTLQELGEACEELADRKQSLVASVLGADERVAEASTKLDKLETVFADARQRTKDLAGEHGGASLEAAWHEVQDARTDLDEMRTLVSAARAQLDQRRHVMAEYSALRALDEHGEAVQNLTELAEVLEKMRRAKLEAEAIFASLASKRASSLSELEGLGKYGGITRMAEGDLLFEKLQGDWRPGVPVDWVARHQRARAVLESWTTQVGQARAAQRAEQARIRAEREAAERRRRAAAQLERDLERSRRSSSNRKRSSSTRSSFSSFGSSSRRKSSSSFGSSSRRSSGRSIGSRSRRSAGRKTSRSKRSGGRKF